MIASSVNRIIYNGDGSNTAFSYPFKILNATDIKLMLVDADGDKTSITSDYYVDTTAKKVYYPGYAPGATEPGADQPPKVATGEKLVIYRDVPINQLDSMPEQWPFDVNENMHDKSCIIDQQLKDAIDRSLKFDVDLSGSFDATLPINAGYGWRVSDDGTKIVPLSNPEGVYNDTLQVYNNAVAATNQIKAETNAIKNTAETYKDAAQSSATAANTAKNSANDYASLAQAWAESAQSPSGVVGDKSSKTWAGIASSNAADAALSANYCKALAADGAAYDSTTTYVPGDATMTSEGNLWRCIAQSTGENPSTSAKWVLVSVVINNTFEPDENGDLMPLMYPKQSSQFDIDENGDIEPAL